jgi:O-antigen ligase
VVVTRSLVRLSATLSFAYVLRATLFGVPTTALEVCLVLSLGAYVVEKRRAGESFPDPRRMPYFWPIVGLLAAAAISVVVAPDRRAAAGIFKAYFVEPALIAYVIADVLRSRRDLEKLVAGFFLSGILVAELNVLVFLFALGVHRPNLVEDPPVMIYFTANATGLFLGPLLAMALAFILFGNRSERTRSWLFCAIAGPAFILSFSRGAWLGLVIAALFLAWHHRRRLILLGAVGIGVLGAVAVPPIRQRIAHQFNPNDKFNSINLRADLWKATFEMMKTGLHPIFGTGLSGFKHDIAPFRSATGYHEDLIYPHNVYLDFYTETGLLGLAAFTWLTVAWVRQTFQTLRLQTQLRPYYIALAAAGVTIFVHGMLDVPFFKNDLAFLTLAIVGMQVAAWRQDQRAAA